MGPEGPFTLIFWWVMISGSVEFEAQSQYATRNESAAARYIDALSPVYR